MTGTFQVNRHHWLSVSAREVPLLTPGSGTRRLAHVGDDHRSVDLFLTMSIPGRNSTAASLVRAGFVVVLVLVNVSGFRSVLARSWHGVRAAARARARRSRRLYRRSCPGFDWAAHHGRRRLPILVDRVIPHLQRLVIIMDFRGLRRPSQKGD